MKTIRAELSKMQRILHMHDWKYEQFYDSNSCNRNVPETLLHVMAEVGVLADMRGSNYNELSEAHILHR
jgi:hypothetical protein